MDIYTVFVNIVHDGDSDDCAIEHDEGLPDKLGVFDSLDNAAAFLRHLKGWRNPFFCNERDSDFRLDDDEEEVEDHCQQEAWCSEHKMFPSTIREPRGPCYGETFTCTECKRTVCSGYGAADCLPDQCDTCWFEFHEDSVACCPRNPRKGQGERPTCSA